MENDINNQQELLAKNLAYYRKASGLTQLELAEKFNYSDKSVSKWERGESVPDVFTLKELANFFNITIEDFFSNKPVTQKKKVRKKNYARAQYMVRRGLLQISRQEWNKMFKK